MSSVKNYACLLAFCLPLLAGCGGTDDVRIATATRYVPVTLAVQWDVLPPTGTRTVVAPAGVRSAVVRITDLSVNPAGENDLVTIATLNRDPAIAGAYRQSFTTATLVARPNRDTVAVIDFYSQANGAGTLLASAKKRTILAANGDLGDFEAATAVPQN